MNLEEAVLRVKKAAKRIQRLEGAIRERLEPKASQGRQIPIVFTQSFVFEPTFTFLEGQGGLTKASLPMNTVQQTIVNGAEDCYLKEASYSAFFIPQSLVDAETQTLADVPTEAVDFPNVLSPVEYVISGSLGQSPQFTYAPSFNFQWNATLMSTQASYLSQANNAQFLSRRSLGHARRSIRRQLYSSLPFKAGDALLLSVKPTYWGLPAARLGVFRAQHPAVQLTISLFGTRGPDMVELAEDADLEP